MKRLFQYCVLALTVSSRFVCSEINEDGLGLVHVDEPDAKGPISIDAGVNVIGKAKVTTNDFKDSHIRFSQGELEAGMIFWYDPVCEEGAQVTVGYTRTHMDWSDNPFFDETNFNTASVCLGAFSSRLDDWMLKSQVCININTEHPNWEYTDYNLLFWGRYVYSRTIGVHVGFYAETGMKIDHVYPILGVDWQATEKLKLNLVFPLDMSIVYSLNQHWSVAVNGRIFDCRYRVGKDEVLRRGLFVYRTTGAELALNYAYSWLKANVHVGSTFQGKLTVADHDYENKRHIRFDGAPYVGGNFELDF